MGIALGAGLILGLAAAGAADSHPELVRAAQWLRPIGTLFVNLLSMVVIPLVATALFTGIARLGNMRRVSRLLVRTLAFFWGTTLVAIFIGFLVGAIVLPRAVVSPDRQAALQAAAVSFSATDPRTWQGGAASALPFIFDGPNKPVWVTVTGTCTRVARHSGGPSIVS